MLGGVDFRTHKNPGKSEGDISDAGVGAALSEHLEMRICLGLYDFAPETGCVDIRYTAGDGDFHITLKLGHAGPSCFADRLEWLQYTRTDKNTGAETYDLGKLPGQEHFPCMDLSPSISLEHSLI